MRNAFTNSSPLLLPDQAEQGREVEEAVHPVRPVLGGLHRDQPPESRVRQVHQLVRDELLVEELAVVDEVRGLDGDGGPHPFLVLEHRVEGLELGRAVITKVPRLLEHQCGVVREHHHVGCRDAVLHLVPHFLDHLDRVSRIVGEVYVETIVSVAELCQEVEKGLVEWTVYD